MRRDFSLIELLIVIGIIAMVSVVALKQFSGSYGPGDRVLVKNLVLKSFAEARLKAKMSGQVVSLKFEKSNDEKIIRVAHISDLEKVDSELELNSEEESFQLPDTSSWSDDAQEAFIFYPDGEASGSEFVMQCDQSEFFIQVDRLNSQLIIDEK